MRKLVVAVVLGVFLGGWVQVPEVAARQGYERGSRVSTLEVRRSIARPERGARWIRPPQGAYLVRGRYWNPALRWKTDRYTRTVYAVHRGEVWFLDPSSGWGYTIDRYGRVYSCDPRYRAVYALGSVADWRGPLPFFFGYFVPDGGYYALPRYRTYVHSYESPRFDDWSYTQAYNYWWDEYDSWFYSRRFVPEVSFRYIDVRHVRYDRYYVRDVYLDRGGRQYLEPERWSPPRRPGHRPQPGQQGQSAQPAYIHGVPTGAGMPGRFARSEDARLPVLNADTRFEAPPPDVAVEVMDRLPAAPELPQVPALPVRVAEVVAVNTQIDTPIPTEAQLVRIEQALPVAQAQPVSSFADVQIMDTTVPEPEPLPEVPADTSFDPWQGLPAADVAESDLEPELDRELTAQDPSDLDGAEDIAEPESAPATVTATDDTDEVPEVYQAEPEIDAVEPETYETEPSYSEPETYEAEPEFDVAEPEAYEAEPSDSEPEPSYSEPEPSYSEPEPSYSEPEPSYAEPEPSYSEPEPSYAEPEPSYSEPEPSYSEPEPSYSEPEPSYSEPEPSYSEPEPSDSEPEPSYSEPEPSYAEPEPSDSEPDNYSSDEEDHPQR